MMSLIDTRRDQMFPVLSVAQIEKACVADAASGTLFAQRLGQLRAADAHARLASISARRRGMVQLANGDRRLQHA